MHKKQTGNKIFTFKVNGEESEEIDTLASALDRSASDAVRQVVKRAVSTAIDLEQEEDSG